jgi:predicted peptidase
MRKTFLLLFICCATTGVFAQDKSMYEKHWFVKGIDTLPYRLLLPKDYDASKKYPLILFLHGAGERGSNNEAQLMHGWSLFLRDSIREKFPAIVVFPQCPANSYWSNVQFVYDSLTKKRTFIFLEKGEPSTAMKMVIELLDELDYNYKLDDDRLYAGGLSMGGMGTFELVRRKPKMFAAAFPICGGANPATAKKIKRPGWWVFHGAKDDVVPPELSQVMVDALKNVGAEVKFTLYPNANHNSWDAAFAEKDLLPWLFSQHK